MGATSCEKRLTDGQMQRRNSDGGEKMQGRRKNGKHC